MRLCVAPVSEAGILASVCAASVLCDVWLDPARQILAVAPDAINEVDPKKWPSANRSDATVRGRARGEPSKTQL
jgi:hypothetical protein